MAVAIFMVSPVHPSSKFARTAVKLAVQAIEKKGDDMYNVAVASYNALDDADKKQVDGFEWAKDFVNKYGKFPAAQGKAEAFKFSQYDKNKTPLKDDAEADEKLQAMVDEKNFPELTEATSFGAMKAAGKDAAEAFALAVTEYAKKVPKKVEKKK